MFSLDRVDIPVDTKSAPGSHVRKNARWGVGVRWSAIFPSQPQAPKSAVRSNVCGVGGRRPSSYLATEACLMTVRLDPGLMSVLLSVPSGQRTLTRAALRP
jgi:hypothetical protein